jgi:hypothetical protein
MIDCMRITRRVFRLLSLLRLRLRRLVDDDDVGGGAAAAAAAVDDDDDDDGDDTIFIRCRHWIDENAREIVESDDRHVDKVREP